MFYHVFLKIIHNELLTKSDTWPIILLQYYLFKMLNWSTTKEYCNIMQKEEKEILEMGGKKKSRSNWMGPLLYSAIVAAFGTIQSVPPDQSIPAGGEGEGICLKKYIWARSMLDSF